jgi:hypothetical protein
MIELTHSTWPHLVDVSDQFAHRYVCVYDSNQPPGGSVLWHPLVSGKGVGAGEEELSCRLGELHILTCFYLGMDNLSAGVREIR